MNVKRLFKLRTPGHGANSASVTFTGIDINLSYNYKDSSGTEFQGYVTFKYCIAYRFTDEGHMGPYASESFDAVAEASSSEWIDSLIKNASGRNWPFERRHYIVYLRDHGIYDIAAESVLEEESIKITI
jgi:hypothetical protein